MNRFKTHLTGTVALLGVALLAGCEKQPEGQVVAVVNGDEVTLQELNNELGNADLPEGEAKTEARNRALDSIINRRLLAGIAQEQGIDDSPEYIVRRRQLEEALLVQMLAQRTARPMKQPTAQEVNAFVAENPQMFADRAILSVDQIRFPTPARQDYIAALRPAKTMADVVTVLNRLGIKFERATTQVDSGNLPREMFERIKAVGSAEPFVIPSPGGVSVGQVVASRPAPLPANQVTPAATSLIQRRNLGTELDTMIKAAKAEAGIDYQDGFAAPKASATSPAAATAPALPTAAETGAGR